MGLFSKFFGRNQTSSRIDDGNSYNDRLIGLSNNQIEQLLMDLVRQEAEKINLDIIDKSGYQSRYSLPLNVFRSELVALAIFGYIHNSNLKIRVNLSDMNRYHKGSLFSQTLLKWAVASSQNSILSSDIYEVVQMDFNGRMDALCYHFSGIQINEFEVCLKNGLKECTRNNWSQDSKLEFRELMNWFMKGNQGIEWVVYDETNDHDVENFATGIESCFLSFHDFFYKSEYDYEFESEDVKKLEPFEKINGSTIPTEDQVKELNRGLELVLDRLKFIEIASEQGLEIDGEEGYGDIDPPFNVNGSKYYAMLAAYFWHNEVTRFILSNNLNLMGEDENIFLVEFTYIADRQWRIIDGLGMVLNKMQSISKHYPEGYTVIFEFLKELEQGNERRIDQIPQFLTDAKHLKTHWDGHMQYWSDLLY